MKFLFNYFSLFALLAFANLKSFAQPLLVPNCNIAYYFNLDPNNGLQYGGNPDGFCFGYTGNNTPTASVCQLSVCYESNFGLVTGNWDQGFNSWQYGPPNLSAYSAGFLIQPSGGFPSYTLAAGSNTYGVGNNTFLATPMNFSAYPCGTTFSISSNDNPSTCSNVLIIQTLCSVPGNFTLSPNPLCGAPKTNCVTFSLNTNPNYPPKVFTHFATTIPTSQNAILNDPMTPYPNFTTVCFTYPAPGVYNGSITASYNAFPFNSLAQCKTTWTFQTIVNALDAGPSYTICPGQTVTLLANPCPVPPGTTTFTWFPAAGLNNQFLLQPNASPSITTTYTFVQTINNGGIITTSSATTQVVVNPLNVSFIANKDCFQNAFFTPFVFCNSLSYGNNVSYLWNFGDGQTSTQVNPSHNYANPGTYPVSLTVSIGNYSVTVTQNVVIYSSTPDITGKPLSLCSPSALGTGNYFINNPNPNSTFSWSVIVSYTTTTPLVYTFSIPFTTNGNSAISIDWNTYLPQYQNVTDLQGPPVFIICAFDNFCKTTNCITLSGCCKRSPISDFPNQLNLTNVTFVPTNGPGVTVWPFGNVPNNQANLSGLVWVPGGLILNQNLNIIGSLTFGQNVNMTFSSSTQLIFNEGVPVNVNNSANVIFDKSTLQGCYYMWSGITNNGNLSFIDSRVDDARDAVIEGGANTTTLNVIRSLFNRNFAGVFLNQTPVANSNFSFYGNIFTSRDFVNVAPQYSNLLSNALFQNSNLSAVVGPSLDIIYNSANLKGSPLMGIPSTAPLSYGVYAKNIPITNTLIVGLVQPGPPTAGVNNRTNWFDNGINSGVYIENSNGQFVNNVFQHFSNANALLANGVTLVNSTNPNANPKPIVKFGNTGNNPSINRFKFLNNGIIASREGRFLVNNNIFSQVSNAAVFLTSWNAVNPASYSVNITDNTFSDCFYDVFAQNNARINASVLTNVSTYSQQKRPRQTINVVLLEINKPITALYNVSHNTFNNKVSGILASNVYSATINANSITVSPPAPAGIFMGNQNADIWLNNCDQSNITNNILNVFPTQSSSFNTHGIFSNICVNNLYKCNDIKGAGTCMKFNGACPSFIQKNTLNANPSDPCKYGIELDNNGYTGPIQFNFGPFNFPADDDNVFGDFNYGGGGADTWVQSGNGSAITYPGAAVISNNLFPFFNGTTNNQFNPPFIPVNNPLTGLVQCSGNGNGQGNKVSMGIPPFFTNGQNFGPNTATVNAIARKSIYELFLKNAINTNSVAGSAQFLNTEAATTTGTFNVVDSLSNSFVLTNNPSDLSQAVSLNSIVNPPSNVESNQQQFNTIYHTFLQSDTLVTQAQMTALIGLAQLCPFTDGTSVYQARALLRHYDTTEYYNTCELVMPGVNNRMFHGTETAKEVNNSLKAIETRVFPNPAANELTVQSEAEGARIVIYNLVGQEIINEAITSELKLNISEMKNGTYLYKIYVDKAVLKADKLIINK